MHLPHDMPSQASDRTGGVSKVWTNVELLCSHHAEIAARMVSKTMQFDQFTGLHLGKTRPRKPSQTFREFRAILASVFSLASRG